MFNCCIGTQYFILHSVAIVCDDISTINVAIVSDRPPERVVDVVPVARGDRPLPRPPQLSLHCVLSETLCVAAAERLCLPQLTEGTAHTHTSVFSPCSFCSGTPPLLSHCRHCKYKNISLNHSAKVSFKDQRYKVQQVKYLPQILIRSSEKPPR